MISNLRLITFLLLLTGCYPKPRQMHQKPNRLANSSSPYLRQHAYNPVEWYPWGAEALQKAKAEDKPIIVSIGYSSCHWCHVMERESFENDTIAQLMNRRFISIKVDREERPDVDQLYMDAVQAMGQNGGWPLNVFLTPDQKPFYGGTYFPPDTWTQLLENVAEAFEKKRNDIEKSADRLATTLSVGEPAKYNLTPGLGTYPKEPLDAAFSKMATRFDGQRGGMNRAPKFPMPGQWEWLLHYHYYTGNDTALEQVLLTLDQMAMGGIYDQAGGGFARYSTDADWLVPHFEKMLYDNGQLLSLYAQAYKLTGKSLYRQVVYRTTDWLAREMRDGSGGFYAALDADSDGEEGKYYVWTAPEFEKATGGIPWANEYYGVIEEGNWEEGKNILHRKQRDEVFAATHGLSVEELTRTAEQCHEKLLEARASRTRPGLDDKLLAGWNGLVLAGLCDAYDAFGDNYFLELALANARFITTEMIKDGRLYRSYKNGIATINAYLEDYAAVISAFVKLYQSTFDEEWIQQAKTLTDYTLAHFYDEEEKLFFFTDDRSEALIARKKEIFDNVIPASNSIMADNLYNLGIIYDSEQYKKTAEAMLNLLSRLATEEPAYTYKWAMLYGKMAYHTAEIAIVGEDAEAMRAQLAAQYNPNKIVMGTKAGSRLPLLANKSASGNKTTIFVCYHKTCKLPVHSVEAALRQIK